MKIDLDALKRARIEAEEEPHELVFGGKTFTLPPVREVPVEFLEALDDAGKSTDGGILKVKDLGKLRNIMRPVLNGQADEFFACMPSAADYAAAIQGLSDLYIGGAPGEAEASGSSSKNTGKTLRQPSRKSTPA
jgi:hypothetical protein